MNHRGVDFPGRMACEALPEYPSAFAGFLETIASGVSSPSTFRLPGDFFSRARRTPCRYSNTAAKSVDT